MFNFNKNKRLTTKNEYGSVFESASKIVTQEFVLLYCFNNIGWARLGLAISKKAVKKAHDRNKIKRLLRESFRSNSEIPPVDIVVLTRAGINLSPQSDIFLKAIQAWKKLILACKK